MRYADDCNIYVRSLRAGERVMASVSQFLEKKLKLKVNQGPVHHSLIQQHCGMGLRASLSSKPSSTNFFKTLPLMLNWYKSLFMTSVSSVLFLFLHYCYFQPKRPNHPYHQKPKTI